MRVPSPHSNIYQLNQDLAVWQTPRTDTRGRQKHHSSYGGGLLPPHHKYAGDKRLDQYPASRAQLPSPTQQDLADRHTLLFVGRDWGNRERCDKRTNRALNPPYKPLVAWRRIGSTPWSPHDNMCSASKLVLRVHHSA